MKLGGPLAVAFALAGLGIFVYSGGEPVVAWAFGGAVVASVIMGFLVDAGFFD